MAKLNTLTIETREVEIADGKSLTVRGLGSYDISDVCNRYLPEITMLVGVTMASEAAHPDMDALINLLIKSAPELVNDLILIANDSDREDEPSMKAVRALPVFVEINALFAIFELTLKSEAEVKKIMEMLTGVMETATVRAIEVQTKSSQTGE